VTKSRAEAQSRAAYIAGQKAAYESIGAMQSDVVVLGNVQKHEIPWVEGLTLSQAIATAGYNGQHDPAQIIVRHHSVETQVDPKQLLGGQDVALQPGDTVLVVGQ
jgi:hypothetical protein